MFHIYVVPLCKAAEAGAEGGGGTETEVAFEGRGVGVSYGDVAGLHRYKFLVRLEVVVGGKDAGANQFFLKDGNEVKKILRRAVADVVHLVWRNRKAVLAVGSLRRMTHHTYDAFDNIVHIREITLAIAVVEYPDCIALYKFVRKTEIRHIGTSARAVDGEETQAC